MHFFQITMPPKRRPTLDVSDIPVVTESSAIPLVAEKPTALSAEDVLNREYADGRKCIVMLFVASVMVVALWFWVYKPFTKGGWGVRCLDGSLEPVSAWLLVAFIIGITFVMFIAITPFVYAAYRTLGDAVSAIEASCKDISPLAFAVYSMIPIVLIGLCGLIVSIA